MSEQVFGKVTTFPRVWEGDPPPDPPMAPAVTDATAVNGVLRATVVVPTRTEGGPALAPLKYVTVWLAAATTPPDASDPFLGLTMEQIGESHVYRAAVERPGATVQIALSVPSAVPGQRCWGAVAALSA